MESQPMSEPMVLRGGYCCCVAGRCAAAWPSLWRCRAGLSAPSRGRRIDVAPPAWRHDQCRPCRRCVRLRGCWGTHQSNAGNCIAQAQADGVKIVHAFFQRSKEARRGVGGNAGGEASLSAQPLNASGLSTPQDLSGRKVGYTLVRCRAWQWLHAGPANPRDHRSCTGRAHRIVPECRARITPDRSDVRWSVPKSTQPYRGSAVL